MMFVCDAPVAVDLPQANSQSEQEAVLVYRIAGRVRSAPQDGDREGDVSACGNSIVHRSDLANVTTELLRGLFPLKKSVRLLGVSVSGFAGEETDDPAQIALEF
jgi:hypothetical protein